MPGLSRHVYLCWAACGQALKEAYLPESGLWLADYPHVNRDAFLELSLAIERERKAADAELQQQAPTAAAAGPAAAAPGWRKL